MPSPIHTPVLIVGAGRWGSRSRAILAGAASPALLIEKTDGAIEQPEDGHRRRRAPWNSAGAGASSKWVETRRLQPRDYPQDYVWVTALHDGYELGREPFPGRADAEPAAAEPAEARALSAGYVRPGAARALRATFPHVTAPLQHRARSTSSETAEGVWRTRARPRNRRDERIEADYLVGCDGGASTVREPLGIAHERQPGARPTPPT